MQANHHCIFSTLSRLEHDSLNFSAGKKPPTNTENPINQIKTKITELQN